MSRLSLLVTIIAIMVTLATALPRKPASEDKLIAEGRKMLQKAIKNEEREEERRKNNMTKKQSRSICRKNLFKPCLEDSDCGCDISCRVTVLGFRTCIPNPSPWS